MSLKEKKKSIDEKKAKWFCPSRLSEKTMKEVSD